MFNETSYPISGLDRYSPWTAPVSPQVSSAVSSAVADALLSPCVPCKVAYAAGKSLETSPVSGPQERSLGHDLSTLALWASLLVLIRAL